MKKRMIRFADEALADGLRRDDTDGEIYALCPSCGYEQPDMGRNMKCEECGHAPMPFDAPRPGGGGE